MLAPSLPEAGGRVVLSQEASKHARVLRLRVGDAVVLFDGRGSRADATVIEEGAYACEAGPRRSTIADRPEVHLIQALPKQPTLEDVVRSTTEIGVTAIHLASSAHAVPRTVEARGERRRERLERIAEEAARQCERDDVPALHDPESLLAVAARADGASARLVLCGRSGGPFPTHVTGPVWLVVGPEGGLSEAEVASLVALGFRPVSLAATTMRVATAATAAVAVAMDRSRR